jgi:hypothetical protein
MCVKAQEINRSLNRDTANRNRSIHIDNNRNVITQEVYKNGFIIILKDSEPVDSITISEKLNRIEQLPTDMQIKEKEILLEKMK